MNITRSLLAGLVVFAAMALAHAVPARAARGMESERVQSALEAQRPAPSGVRPALAASPLSPASPTGAVVLGGLGLVLMASVRRAGGGEGAGATGVAG